MQQQQFLNLIVLLPPEQSLNKRSSLNEYTTDYSRCGCGILFGLLIPPFTANRTERYVFAPVTWHMFAHRELKCSAPSFLVVVVARACLLFCVAREELSFLCCCCLVMWKKKVEDLYCRRYVWWCKKCFLRQKASMWWCINSWRSVM